MREAEGSVADSGFRDAGPGDAAEPAVALEEDTAGPFGRRVADIVEASRRSGRADAGAGAGGNAGRDVRVRARMLRRISREVRLIRGVDDRFYAQVPVASHRKVLDLSSATFRYWLIRRYRRRLGTVPNREAIAAITRAFEADAIALESAEHVWIRVGNPKKVIGPGLVHYLDLGDPTWHCVEIRPEGCQILEHAPVFFRRPRSFGALPRPEWGASIDLLRKYLNINDADYPLFVAWITAALRPVGPYPILLVTGEQGSAKSTMARVDRQLTDPSSGDLKGPPSGQQNFLLQVYNNWALTYDNLSWISDALSDAFCRTSTGGGSSFRTLYTNESETIFDVQRPMIITGIDDLVLRSDLIDRGLGLVLPAIPDAARRPDHAFWAEFEADRPRLLGAILSAVAGGLRMLPEVDLPALPRMADFAQWGEAVIRGLGWEPGSFLKRYHQNRRAASRSALEDSEVAQALCGMAESLAGPWCGTATDLLQVLPGHARQNATRTTQWPKTPRLLSSALRRITAQLRTIDIAVDFGRMDGNRTITISRKDGTGGARGISGGNSST
jgi:hypothetical protein